MIPLAGAPLSFHFLASMFAGEASSVDFVSEVLVKLTELLCPEGFVRIFILFQGKILYKKHIKSGQ